MINFFKKTPYACSLLIILLLSLIFLPVRNIILDKSSEKELNELISANKGILATCIDDLVTPEKEPPSEENAYSYYKKAIDKIETYITNKDKKFFSDSDVNKEGLVNDKTIEEMIRTGNSKAHFYVCDPNEYLNMNSLQRSLSFELELRNISMYYGIKIDNAIDNEKYDQAYENMHDLLAFLSKSFIGNKNINSYPQLGATYTYLGRLKSANKLLEKLQIAEFKYDEQILSDINSILESHKALGLKTIKADFVSLLTLDFELDYECFYFIKNFNLHQYQKNMMKIALIRQQLEIEQILQTGITDLYSENTKFDVIYRKADDLSVYALNTVKKDNMKLLNRIKESEELWTQSLKNGAVKKQL